MENETEKILIDVQKEYANSNRKKDKIIVLLIVLMFLEAIVCYQKRKSKFYGCITKKKRVCFTLLIH